MSIENIQQAAERGDTVSQAQPGACRRYDPYLTDNTQGHYQLALTEMIINQRW